MTSDRIAFLNYYHIITGVQMLGAYGHMGVYRCMGAYRLGCLQNFSLNNRCKVQGFSSGATTLSTVIGSTNHARTKHDICKRDHKIFACKGRKSTVFDKGLFVGRFAC